MRQRFIGHAALVAVVAALLWLHVAYAAPLRRVFVPSYRAGVMTQVIRTRVARGELTWAQVRRYGLFVASPFGTVGDVWRVCANDRCWTALQVDVPRPEHRAWQIRTNRGLEVSETWYPALGCVVGEPPRTCAALIRKVTP